MRYLIGTLALLPFCIAIGTYNALHTQILFSLAPWGVLVGLLAFGIPTLPGSRHAAMLVGVLFVTIVTSQVLTNGWLSRTLPLASPFAGADRGHHHTFLGNVSGWIEKLGIAILRAVKYRFPVTLIYCKNT